MAIQFTTGIDVANSRITSVGNPTADTDATNKIYVDNIAQGLVWKESVVASSTADVDLSAPGTTLDGVTLAQDDRVLLRHQTDPIENGIYVFDTDSTALVRAEDADTSAKLRPGSAVSVEEGTANADRTYVLVSDGPITLDTDPLNFSLLNGGTAPVYTAGDGIALAGGAFALSPVAGGGLVASGAGAAVDPAVVVRKFAMDIGDGVATTIPVTHNLNTYDVNVEVFVNSGSRETVFAEVTRTSVNAVAVVFGAAPANAAYRVVVHG